MDMKVEKIMEPPFPQVNEDTPIGPIKPLLEHYQAVLVTRKNQPVGIISQANPLLAVFLRFVIPVPPENPILIVNT